MLGTESKAFVNVIPLKHNSRPSDTNIIHHWTRQTFFLKTFQEKTFILLGRFRKERVLLTRKTVERDYYNHRENKSAVGTMRTGTSSSEREEETQDGRQDDFLYT